MSISIRRPRPSPNRLLAFALVLPLGLGAVGCAAVDVRTQIAEPVDLAQLDSYAWLTSIEAYLYDAEDALLNGRTRASQILSELGLVQAPVDQADLLLALDLEVEVVDEVADPFYSHDYAARAEVGHTTLEVYERTSGEIRHKATASKRLRTLSLATGLVTERWTPVEEPRTWSMDRKVDALFANLQR